MTNEEALLCSIKVIYIYFIITAMVLYIGDNSINIVNIVIESIFFLEILFLLYLLYIYWDTYCYTCYTIIRHLSKS